MTGSAGDPVTARIASGHVDVCLTRVPWVCSTPFGSAVDPDVIEALELLYTGTLVWAGMGYEDYPEISLRLLKSARLILR